MNHRESMEEDDMVKSRVGNTPSTERRTDEEDKRAASPRDLIKGCQKIPYKHSNKKAFFIHIIHLVLLYIIFFNFVLHKLKIELIFKHRISLFSLFIHACCSF